MLRSYVIENTGYFEEPELRFLMCKSEAVMLIQYDVNTLKQVDSLMSSASLVREEGT